MIIQNPATPPAQAGATPGSDANVITPPSTTTPPVVPEGKVTISTKEYADLQRAKARTLSFEKRLALKNNSSIPLTNPDGSPMDDASIQRIATAVNAQQAAEKRALQAEVRGKVRDLLEKDEFRVLPRSTKDLILKNPAMLSEADTLDEAMLDIEDFVRESVASMETPIQVGGTPAPKTPENPSGHETPPASGSAPAPTHAVQLEDVSNLKGPARSQAIIRNALKKRDGVV